MQLAGTRDSRWRAAAAAPVLRAPAGTPTLNWYIFHDVSGSFPADAAACSAASNGEYNIRIQELPAAADGQRQQLRLWFDPSKLHLFNTDNGAHLTL